MKPFRFIHASDAHLGYMQYNLLERREDFLNAFREFIEKTKELSPDFVVFAGDLFDDPHPSNLVLSSAIELIDSLKVPFLVVSGSHDNMYSALVGTVLDPLHRGGHIHYLQVKPFEYGDVYVYGMRNFRRRVDFEREGRKYFDRHPPEPRGKYNIFVLHQGVDFPRLRLRSSETELYPAELPKGFQYYACGHLHKPVKFRFNDGIFAYSGCFETFSYDEYDYEKGFYLVEVQSDGETEVKRIPLTCYRRFNIIKEDFTGLDVPEIEERAQSLISNSDRPEYVVVLVLNGTLPQGVSRADINYNKIKSAASECLYVHLVNNLRTPEEKTGPVSIAGAETIYAKAERKLIQYYTRRYKEDAGRYASFTVDLTRILSNESMKSKERITLAEKRIDEFYDAKKRRDESK